MLERSTFIARASQGDSSISYLKGILTDARVTTLQRVNNIEAAEIHWQYRPGWNTIGVLLSHIIAIEHVFRIEFIEQRSMNEEEELLWNPGCEMGKFIPELITNSPVSFYIDQLAKSRAQLFEAIDQLDDNLFYEKRTGYNHNTGCNLAWILYHLAEDEVHHRGQISILRKLYAVR